MNLSPSANVEFGNDNAFAVFLGDHEIDHANIARVITSRGRLMATVPLADTPSTGNDWLMDHYQLHLAIGSATGLPVPDLVSYDLEDESQYYDWMAVHGKVHSSINETLGIV